MQKTELASDGTHALRDLPDDTSDTGGSAVHEHRMQEPQKIKTGCPDRFPEKVYGSPFSESADLYRLI